MGRLTSLALVALAAGSAQAGPKKKVQVESKPKGASVFVGTTDKGEECKTPCSVDVDGDTTLIVSLDGHRPKIDQLVFGRQKPPYKRSYVLEAMLGTLKVEGPAGASVFVDNVEKGKIPFSDDVSAGKRNVVVKLDGRELYSSTVEIPEDDELKVTVTNKPSPKVVGNAGGSKTDPDPDPDPDPTKITKPGTPKAAAAGKLFALSAATSVGFRKFTYKNVTVGTTREDRGEETEAGQVLAGGLLEVWPGTIAGVRPLRGFSIAARVQFGVNSQTVIENANATLKASTFWGSIDVSGRQKWTFGTFGVEVSAGFVRDQFQFTGDSTEILKVPDVLYQSLRIGGRASAMLGMVEPYVAFETRIVLSGGNFENRFPSGATANGIRLGAGAELTIAKVAGGKVSGFVEGTLTRYTWTFVNDGMTDADGATDQIAQVAVSVGYAY